MFGKLKAKQLKNKWILYNNLDTNLKYINLLVFKIKKLEIILAVTAMQYLEIK